ncbi:MAG TPA: hypothetical protein VEL47_02505 [Myxococcota bacterium]|nr:hypothetical protein [Myxococcota bacterium]
MDEQLIATFCEIDDFCKEFEGFWYRWLKDLGIRKRVRRDVISLSEFYSDCICGAN